MVFRTCFGVLGDARDAEDAAQEAFVIAFRSLADWRGEGPFGAWIGRIAVRIAVRHATHRQPVGWLVPTETGMNGERGDPGWILDPATPETRSMGRPDEVDPSALVLGAERAQLVRAAVVALDEPYREVVALRFFAQLSLEEIATETARPVGTVKTHLRRGLVRLRRHLATEPEP